jgi:pimeloyl-ACP methyl ester carboxylesterase
MDIQHHYTEHGNGFPLILLHGNGEDSTYFEKQFPAFSQRYHVYAVDTRGHGKTARGSAPFTIRQFADDLAGFMKSRQIEKADILGFSDGANIAMLFAIKYPALVNKLVLNGGNLDAGGVKRMTQIPIEIGYRIARLFAGRSESARAKAEMLGLMVNDPDIKPEELAAIKAPTLVIVGTDDMIKESHTKLIAANIPGAELAFIKGGHFIASENPTEFNQKVLEFLQK